jgi:formate-dependent nitrite reductase membrane component NrfD
MESYEWMAKYTPQTEWINRRGVMLWLAFFFIELGAGMFFVASFFANVPGMLVGWLVCAVLGGGFHMAFLGHPMRFWRMVFSSGWKTSWISRGLIFVLLFLLHGIIHMALLQWGHSPAGLVVAADIFAFLTIIYGGFAMNYVNGIPLWNTALLPVLYVISGLWGGAEVVSGMALATGSIGTSAAVEAWIRLLLIGFIVLIPIYLMSVRYTSGTGMISVRYIVTGKWAGLFWPGVVVVGMLVPLAAVAASFIGGLETVPAAFLYAAILCGLLGDLAMRYLILSCGLYTPLVPAGSGPLAVSTGS